jgi:hydroxypyruvate reductase
VQTVLELPQLREAALEIFGAALRSCDAQEAVRRAVHLKGTSLNICDTEFDLSTSHGRLYSIAIGKAAHKMAAALDELLGERLKAGLVAGLPLRETGDPLSSAAHRASSLSKRWRVFAGGHPLPNEESLAAARAAFELLSRADNERALVIFLISGGGSALLEWPRDERVTLKELREANQMLVHCGASIAEINAVRRAISAVKGGGLARRAPHAEQVSLIISDTNRGEESAVASGPTLAPPHNAPDPSVVVARYDLTSHLPASILRALAQSDSTKNKLPGETIGKHYVLLTNGDAVAAAAAAARRRGFIVEIASDIIEQEIDDGCTQLTARLLAAYRRAATARAVGERPLCLLSGGEFACPVRGQGLGGRNSETALRLALKMREQLMRESIDAAPSHTVALSAGTDGIDGNSPAAGALSDETTIKRAQSLNMDAQEYLSTSDAYSFFAALNDAIMIGPTGTNVRDVRVLLAN